ncbi:hypothetical protein SEMRO_2_G001150.1 [Seminavis robusta]|uniref:Uncharacterized protein n=1 Tax=Seminavis robusta TaxID=568900 RepID=A0A9N8H3X7_9STRA|nr:hypothetical protein SEMRO_2_G001150.1 [Seminavis robusta]|eukprot:Sro2_g001150.1 n/a (245) ;mRNA; f:36672-37406
MGKTNEVWSGDTMKEAIQFYKPKIEWTDEELNEMPKWIYDKMYDSTLETIMNNTAKQLGPCTGLTSRKAIIDRFHEVGKTSAVLLDGALEYILAHAKKAWTKHPYFLTAEQIRGQVAKLPDAEGDEGSKSSSSGGGPEISLPSAKKQKTQLPNDTDHCSLSVGSIALTVTKAKYVMDFLSIPEEVGDSIPKEVGDSIPKEVTVTTDTQNKEMGNDAESLGTIPHSQLDYEETTSVHELNGVFDG